MARRSFRSTLVLFALVLGTIVGPLSTPAVAATCKVDGQNVSCSCPSPTQVAGFLWRAECNAIGIGAVSCVAYSPTGPWTCTQKMSSGYTHSTPMNDCTYNASGAGVGLGGGFALTNVYAYEHSFSGGSCAAPWNRPVGSLASDIQFYRWSGSGWSLCRDSGWYYSNVSTWAWELGWSFGSSTPCGAGYYHTAGFGYQFNGFDWRGGYIATDYLYLAGGSGLQAAGADTASAGSDASLSAPTRPIAPSEIKMPKLPPRPPKGGFVPEQMPEGLFVNAR
jgi:hypothetical protein